MTRVFISHSHEDKAYAQRLAAEMKRRGIEPWIDDRIEYGDEWPQVIKENLESCPILVVIMSRASSKSKWVQRAVFYAEQKNKLILPILLEGENWFSFVITQYADAARGNLPDDEFFDKILHYKGQAGQAKTASGRPESPPPLSREELELKEQIARILKGMVVHGKSQTRLIGLFKIAYTPRQGTSPVDSHLFTGEVGDEFLLSKYDPQTFTEFKVNMDALEKRWNEINRRKPVNPLLGVPDPDLAGALFNYTLPKSDLEKRLHLYASTSFAQLPTDAQLREYAETLVRVHKQHCIPVGAIRIAPAK